MAADQEPSSSQKRAQRGSSGLPSGISKRGKKFQARLCYVPTGGTKKELRGVGTFVTVEEAVAALAEAQRKLAEGGAAAVWQTEKETRAARGSVRTHASNHASVILCVERALLCCAQVVRPEKKPRQESKHMVKMPGVGRGNNPASHKNLQPRAKKEQNENNEPEPQYGVLPTSINEVSRSCPPMSAFLLQDPGPWRVLQAMDGSGELCM
jgi:hypothetical protein